MFEIFSEIFNDGLLPCMKMFIDFLLGEGLYLGLLVIFVPLLGRILHIFKKFY